MFIGHSRPIGITVSGATLLTPPDALFDGKPARVTRVEFEGGSLTDYVAPVMSWATPTVVRIVHIIFQGGIPAGAKVELRGRRPADGGYTYALGGNALTQRTVQRPDGTVMLTAVFAAGLDPIIGLEPRIFDDANGVTYATGYIDIGELFFGEGEEWCIRPTPGSGIDDPTLFEQSIGNQPHVVQRKAAQTVTLEIAPVSFDSAFMAQQSLQRLRARLVGKTDCVVIFTTRPPHTGRGAMDYDVINAVAMFGKCTTVGDLRADTDGRHWTMQLTFRESPGRLNP